MTDGKMMLELMRNRQSDRKYSKKPIEKEILERIIEAGRLAPSACNAQPWKFIIVTEPDLLGMLAEASSAKLLGMNGFVKEAPVIIAIVRENANFTSRIGGKIKNKDYSFFDIGIAAENICLQAESEGIGSCILGWFDEKLVKKTLEIPRSKRVELMITIGYSLNVKRDKKRKDKDLTVSYNRY